MPHILIAGEDALAAAVERMLRSRGNATARLREAAFDLEASNLADASALVLCADDDGGNVSLALRARRLSSTLPIVARVFEAALVDYLSQSLPGAKILSMSAVTAPIFADAARQALARQPAPAPVPVARQRQSRRRRFRVDPILLFALVALFSLVFPSALFFSHALGLRYMDALYFVWTTVMTVGYGDISLKDASDGAKLFGMLLMLMGAAFIAILFAILSDWVLSRRLDMLYGRTPERGQGHVIVVGAGNIGFRVCSLLTGLGRRLVVVEREASSRNAAILAAGHHVIIADATQEDTLQLAGLPASSLLLALTDSDAVNLDLALACRRFGVPVIMRADSPELAAHVEERGDGVAFSPVDLATSAFCDAAAAAVRNGV